MNCSLVRFEADNTGRDDLASDDAAGGCWRGHGNAHCNRSPPQLGRRADVAMASTAMKEEWRR
jgi:hypothetical protein